MSEPVLVIFDCDGTLVDSQHRIGASMAMAFRACGHEAPSTALTRTVVGLSLDAAIARISPDLTEQQITDISEAYKSSFMQFRQHGLHEEPLFEGARAALEWLSSLDNVLLGIATGKSRRGLDAVLDREELRHHFSTLQTADDAPSKPHPGMVLNALGETGASAGNCVVVGDTSFDMKMAVNAGAHALGVSWGYHPDDHLHRSGAFSVLDSYAELPSALAPILAGEQP